ncbi:recombinase family protein [Phormidium sp. LEGE 05292]|uniref:recombinase family protein n=1 Tax=[Phormidium] sp. LEGE 05292 TaxID=767427 RepID=UPI0018815CD2|nr:recombinase family protein [Phormidium sp. LEGE 05292]MBE9225086.1 recombinase family protein [Phormidium sp. LEGE 05292]
MVKSIAYIYSDPLWETTPEISIFPPEIEQIYQDLGERQQLQKLLTDSQIEPPENLLIRSLAELGDSVQEVCDRLQEIESLGIKLIIAEKDSSISQNSTIDLLKLLQEIQNNQRSRRLKQGHARNRLKALPPPGKAPYGYRRGKDKYIIDKASSPVVRYFFDQFLLFGSLRGAVRYLAKKYGKKISVSTGKRWLINPVYRGDLAYKNNQIISDTHVGIISREEAAQIDRLLRRNQRMSPRTASAPRSLAGLVVCGECRSPMNIARVTTPRTDKEYLYLRPINCPKFPKCRAISYQEILDQTIQLICQNLPQAVAQMQLPDMGEMKKNLGGAIAQKQQILTQLPNLIQQGILDQETSQIRAYKLRTEIAKLQSKLAELPPVNLRETAQAVSIPQFWQDLSESERRFYFREFIREIQLLRQDKDWQLQIKFIFFI